MKKNLTLNQKDIMKNENYPSLEQLKASEEKYMAKKFGRKPATPEELLYWAKVHESKKVETSVSEILKRVDNKFQNYSEIQEQYFSHDEAKKIVWRIIKNMLDIEKREFEIDDTNRNIIVNLVRYFNRDVESEYDLNKGILLYGNFGSGKTFLFRVFKHFLEVINKKSFKIVSTKDIVNEVTASGTEILDKYYTNIFCFDDLGYENSQTKLYGNVITSVEDILFKRHMNRQLTHGTTNLNQEDLSKVYGERMDSRFNQMFNPILLKGIDRRK